MKIIIINGPNLNLLGERNIDIYGNVSFDNYLEDLRNNFSSIDLDYFQSNIEGEIINKLQEVGFTYDFIILNAGGYTHTSISIADCIEAIKTPVIEVHISNIYAREKFRQKSLLSPLCKACIVGLGLDGYRLAVNHIINR
tara:strand:+ start:187 stop:606 length:420 start_codon:yes stop_codon:yes gene_type:complete